MIQPLTKSQRRLVSLIHARMRELGKPDGFVFKQGWLTHCFLDLGMVMVTFDDHQMSALYVPETKLSRVLKEASNYP